jgi:BirA family transcriptional regulator, biotin operon repressor / biotin---[acetyl-CoA-carboxylase] ligase
VSGGPARVLEALRRAGGRTRSGEALSSELGVSRTQVWKHVETLRARGYAIDAEAGGGYRLVAVPDRLYPEEIREGLRTHWLARDIHYFDATDSTNRVALELVREGAPHGATVVAEAQTAGRGRLGRAFFSPAYLNLYTSIVLRPELTTAVAPAWILASASAVAETVAEFARVPDAVEIKWPNDVLLHGLKTCGILMELGAEGARVAHLVLGIGVNLNVDRAAFPEEFRHLATSLASERGRPVERVSFARRLYENLEQTLDLCAEKGFHGVVARFQSRFRMPGRRVRVRGIDGSELAGVVQGIDGDGSLVLAGPDGAELRVVAGDVTLEKESA